MVISKQDYELAQKMATKFTFGNTNSIRYEQFFSAAIDALIKACKRYEKNDNAQWGTYIYRVIMNALVNEKIRLERHELEKADGVDAETLKEVADTQETATEAMVAEVRRIIRKFTTSERNAKMVELFFGVDGKRMPLKDIAEEMNLSHESVRLVVNKTITQIKNDKESVVTIYSYVG